MGGFLAGFTFDSLIAPCERAEFFEMYWDRTPLLLRRSLSDFYEGLISLDEVDAAVAHAPVRLSFVDARAGQGRGWLVHDSDPTRPAVDALLDRMAGGATLILDGAEVRFPGLARICRVLHAEIGFPFHCNLYATPPGGQGFAAHVDGTAVLVLQIAGRKRWRFGRTQVCRPIRGEDGAPAPDGWEADAVEAELAPGDLLYLPRGVAHAAEAGDDGSLHVTLTMTDLSWADLAKVSPGADDPMRDLLPPGFHRDPEGLRVALAERWEGDAGAAVDAFLAKAAGKFRPDLSGRLAGLFDPLVIAAETRIRPAGSMVWHLQCGADDAVLTCGPIRLSFPVRAADAVRALLTHSGTVGELTEDLASDEGLILARTLVRNGLIRRAG